MRLILRLFRWVGAFLLLSIAAAILFTYTSTFREMLREQIVAAVNGAVRGELSIGRLEGSIWSHLTLGDVRIRLEGEDVIGVSRLVLRYSLGTLLAGRLTVDRIEVSEPAVRLRRTAAGTWNLMDAFASTAPAAPAPAAEGGGLPITVALRALVLKDGLVEIDIAGQPPQNFRIKEIALDAGARLGSSGIDAELRRLAAELTSEELPPVRLDVTQLAYRASGPIARVDIGRIVVQTAQSKVEVQGQLTDLERLQTDGSVRIDRLAAAELVRLVPGWPLRADVSGAVHVRGDRAGLKSDFELAAAEAHLRGEGEVDLSGDEPRYRTKLAATDVDLRQLKFEGLAGICAAEVHAKGQGTSLTALEAEAEVEARGLRVEPAHLGDVRTSLRFERGSASLEGNLSGPGRVAWKGQVELQQERYDLSLETAELDVSRLAPGKAPLEGAVTLALRVHGNGFAPERMRAAMDADIEPSKIGPVSVSGGRIAAQIDYPRVRVDELTVEASGARLAVEGQLGLTPEEAAELEYELSVPDVRPWLALARQSGAGSLQLAGRAHGSLTALATSGQLRVKDLRSSGSRIASGKVDFALAELGQARPRGTIDALLEGVEAGVPVQRLTANVVLEAGDVQTAHLQIGAEMPDGLAQRARVDVQIEDDRIAALLQELHIELPLGIWELGAPARVVRTGGGITIEGLQLRSGEQTVDASGTLAAEGNSDLRLRAQGIQLAATERFAKRFAEDIAGEVDADVLIGGTMASPVPSGRLRVQNGRVRVLPLGVAVHDITLDADLRPDRINVAELSAHAKDGSLRLTGGVTLRELVPTSIDLRLLAERWPAIGTHSYQAEIATDVRAQGPLSGPEVRGRIEIVQAQLRPDLAVLQQSGPPPRDETISIVSSEKEDREKGGEGPERQEDGRRAESDAAADIRKNVALDLVIVIQRNTWVKQGDSALELAGTIEIGKPRGDPDPALSGGVRVERGWIYLYGRRFDPQTGEVTFTGGREIDPSLDIVLRSRVANYEVKTIVTGTAQKPALAFESEPPLEQADILSLLTFGRPINDLGEGEKVALSQQAASIAAGYAGSEISQAVGDALGFQISELDVAGKRVGVGRYVTPKTYVSVVEEFGERAAREVQVQYYLTPQWTLQTQTDSEGKSGADVFWQRRY